MSKALEICVQDNPTIPVHMDTSWYFIQGIVYSRFYKEVLIL